MKSIAEQKSDQRTSLTSVMIANKYFISGDVVIPIRDLYGKVGKNIEKLFIKDVEYPILGYGLSVPFGKPALIVRSEKNNRLIFFSDDKEGMGGGQFFTVFEPSYEDLVTTFFDERLPRLVLRIFNENKVLQAVGVEPLTLLALVLEQLPYMSSKERKLKRNEVLDVIEFLKKNLGWLTYDPYKKVLKLTQQGAIELQQSFPKNVPS